MVLGKAPESHVQDGKKLLRCASCANATASGDPAMTSRTLPFGGRAFIPTRIIRKRHRFPDSSKNERN
jgi:hypothetical protein